MRRVAPAAIVATATVFGALNPALGQCITNLCNPPPPVTTRVGLTPLGWYGMGSIACAAVSPMIGTLVLGRELTVTEVDRMALSCFLGPVGWLLGPVLFPDPIVTPTPPPQNPPPRGTRQARGRHIDITSRGVTSFVPNEVLLEVDDGAPAQYLNVVARRLQLTLLETQSFTLTGRSLQRWRIDGSNSVRTTLRGLSPFTRITAAQPNFFYRFGQAQPPAQPAAAAQYVVPKLHLLEAHRITNGDDVLVAVIDSKIDASHPDLVGVIADEHDALGTPAPAHMHGTGMAGAIAAHASGVAALLLARDPKLTPDQVRRLLIKSARHIAGNKRDAGAGVIDALGAVNSIRN